MKIADLGVLRRDREVAVDHDLEPAGGGVALVHRHGRLRAPEDRVADARRALRDLEGSRGADEVALQLVEVEARTERPIAAADDDHADVRVLLGADPGLVELLEQLLAHGVALVRAVQPDARDVAVDFVLDRLDFDCNRH